MSAGADDAWESTLAVPERVVREHGSQVKQVSTMRKLIPLAVCLLGIGTSHAGLMFDRGVDRVRDEAKTSLLASASSWHGFDVNVSELRRADIGPLANYGSIKREYIKYSWAGLESQPSALTTGPDTVPEPGTLALLAASLLAVGVARRRRTR